MAKFIFHTEWTNALLGGRKNWNNSADYPIVLEMICRYADGTTMLEIMDLLEERLATSLLPFIILVTNQIDEDRREHPEIFKEE